MLTHKQGDVFPELRKNPDEIKEILDEEEESFARTLDRGEKLFDKYSTETRERGVKTLNGKDVWRLYDTYGFPVDLTRIMAEELGLDVNEKEFAEAQAASKEASKAGQKTATKDVLKLDVHDIAALEKNASVPKTDDSAKFREYRNRYNVMPFINTHITVLGNSSGRITSVFYDKSFKDSTEGIPDGATFGLILDRTNFYAEAGGQEYDTGNIVIDGVADFEVTNVQVFNGYVLHIGRLKYGTLEVGNEVVCSYDEVCSRQYTH
jgi:alanyl-tRNA synthetase